MDDVHREFVELVDAMLTCDDAGMTSHLEMFLRHAERHFAQEAASMTSSGFPSGQCHLDEHEAVLTSVRDVYELLRSGGDPAVARSLAGELQRWLPAHTSFMDSALAQWLVKQKFGGAPIVFHRG
jgi:hemerythrin